MVLKFENIIFTIWRYIKNACRVTNSIEHDQTAPREPSDLGLHCLRKHFCPNILVIMITEAPCLSVGTF